MQPQKKNKIREVMLGENKFQDVGPSLLIPRFGNSSPRESRRNPCKIEPEKFFMVEFLLNCGAMKSCNKS